MSQSQCQMLLEYLNTYSGINPLEALRDLGIYRLSGRIKDLRNLGYDIVTTMEESTSRFGKKVRFARYSIAAPKGQLELL